MPRSTRRAVEEAQDVISSHLEGLTDEFLECRDPGFGHDWKKSKGFHVIPVKQIGRKVANIAREEICARCGTVKTERFIINEYDRLEKVGQSNSYPEGYLMSGTGVPRGVKRSTLVWTENYRRAMAEVAEAAETGKKPVKGSRGAKVTPLRKRAG